MLRMGPSNRKWKAVVLCATWGLLLGQGFLLPALGQDNPGSPGGSRPILHDKARVVVTSDPQGLAITLNGQRAESSTPAELDLIPGQYFMTVNAEGYQPLNHEMTVLAGEHLQLNFILTGKMEILIRDKMT